MQADRHRNQREAELEEIGGERRIRQEEQASEMKGLETHYKQQERPSECLALCPPSTSSAMA